MATISERLAELFLDIRVDNSDVRRKVPQIHKEFVGLKAGIDRAGRGMAQSLQPFTRSLNDAGKDTDQFARRASTSSDRVEDAVARLERAARRDLDRVGREMDEVGQDARDMASDVERSTERAERSFDELADTARGSAGKIGGAVAGIGGAVGLQGVSEFREELGIIDSRLTNLDFQQIEDAVLGVSSAFGVNQNIVAELARQITDDLAPNAQAFRDLLERGVQLQRSQGLDDVAHAQRLVNTMARNIPEAQQPLAFDQLTLFLQRQGDVAIEELDGITRGLQAAKLAGIDVADFFARLTIKPFEDEEVAGAVFEDLTRELREAQQEGLTIDLDDIFFGTGKLPDTFGEQTKFYIDQVRNMEDAQTIYVKQLGDYHNALGLTETSLGNVRQASGGFADALISVQNWLTRVAGGLLDLFGGFAAALPAIAGGALALNAFGFDLSGVAKGIQSFTARAVPAIVSGLGKIRIATLLAGGKFTLIAAALVGAALLIRKYWDDVSAFFSGFIEGVKQAVQPIIDAFAPLVQALEPLSPLFSTIGDAIGGVVGWFKELLTPVEGTAESMGRASSIGRVFGRVVSEVILAPIRALAGLFGAVIRAVEVMVRLFHGDFSGAAEKVREMFGQLYSIIPAPFRLGIEAALSFRDNVVEAFVWVRDRVVGIWQAVVDFILGAFERVKSIPGDVLDAIPGVEIAKNVLGALPGFASGGVVPGPVGAPQAAIVHGGEVVTPPGAITPIAALLDQLREIIRAIVERLRADIQPLRDAVSRVPAPAPGRGFALPDGVIRMAQGFVAGPEAILPAPSPVLAGAGGTTIVNNSGPPVLNIHENAIVIHATEGQSAVEIGRAVADEIGKIARSMAADADSGTER